MLRYIKGTGTNVAIDGRSKLCPQNLHSYSPEWSFSAPQHPQLCLCGCLVQTLRCRNRFGVCERGGAGLSLDTLGPNHHFGPHELARCLEKVRIAAPPWRKSANAGRNIINICNQQSVSVTSGVSQGGSWHIKIIKPIGPMQGGNIEKLGFSPLYGSTSIPSTTLTAMLLSMRLQRTYM